MLYDHRANLLLYPAFQEFFRKYQPPTPIVWGMNNTVFPIEGALPNKRHLPETDIHVIDTGDFALEKHGNEIAGQIETFVTRRT